MKKIKIIFIEDFHGTKEFYSWQIKQIKNIDSQAVCLEMLPCEKKFKDLCEEVSKGNISLGEFKEKTEWEEHWGTFEGYNSLFEYLYGSGIFIYPIDQKLEKRKALARRELKIIRNIQEGKDTQKLIDKNRTELFLIRGAIFSQNILNLIRTKKFNNITVLVGGNHVERLSNFFNFLDEFEAEERTISQERKKELYPLFRKVHLSFAREKNILEMESPPLVPINVLRFSEMQKAK